jgi:hypothetical protein
MRAVLVGLAVVWSTPVAAQIIMRGGPGGNDPSNLLDVPPAAYGVSGWKTGEWARYNTTQTFGATGQQITRFRTVSVVGSANDRFWIEILEESLGLMRTSVPARKILIPFGAMTDRAMTEALALMPDSSIRHTTVVRPASAAEPKQPFPEGWQRTGEATVTTPAGEFKARHWTKGDEELWTAANAGPLGLVRYRSAGTTIELVGRGATGAKSRIPDVAGGGAK